MMSTSRMKRINRKNPRRSIGQVLQDFYYLSTAHGISHAAAAPNRTKRIFWIAVFLICMTVMCVQLWFIFKKFLTFPFIVQVDVRYTQAIPFPAVTFCNLNPFKASLAQNTKGVKQALMLYSTKMLQSLEPKDEQQPSSVRAKRKVSTVSKASAQSKVPASVGEVCEFMYCPVHAECICEIDEMGRRIPGICVPIHPVDDSMNFYYPKNKYRKRTCICDYDWKRDSIWPCYPSSTWQSKMCIDCDKYGHCPMRFWDANQNVGPAYRCLCHEDFGHCVADIATDIPFLKDIRVQSRTGKDDLDKPATATSTPEVLGAVGFNVRAFCPCAKESQGVLATKVKGKETLVYAVSAVTKEEQVSISYTKTEFILQCSFGGKDCNIENDFKLHVDPVYGNCYTFNQNVTRNGTLYSSRAGENYGLRVMLFSNISDYLPTTEAMGVRVVVHSSTAVPFPDVFGYSAPLGILTSFGIKLGCYRSCFQNELVRRCGCGDPRFPTTSTSKPCNISDVTASTGSQA